MFCHGRHDRGAWAVGLSGMEQQSAGRMCGVPSGSPGFASSRGVMLCHGRHEQGAWAVVLSGMAPSLRAGSAAVRPVSPALRLRHGVPPFHPVSFYSARRRLPGAAEPFFARIACARACARLRAFRAGARFARLIAPARARGQGARHTSPFRFPGFFFRAGAKREAKRSADAAFLPWRHPIMDRGRSSLFGKHFWTFEQAACFPRGKAPAQRNGRIDPARRLPDSAGG